VVQTFAGMVKGRRMKGGREHATNLNAAFELRMKADYSNEDLTETGRQLRDQVRPFLEFCRELVEPAAPAG
jgi:hypothetical protein